MRGPARSQATAGSSLVTAGRRRGAHHRRDAALERGRPSMRGGGWVPRRRRQSGHRSTRDRPVGNVCATLPASGSAIYARPDLRRRSIDAESGTGRPSMRERCAQNPGTSRRWRSAAARPCGPASEAAGSPGGQRGAARRSQVGDACVDSATRTAGQRRGGRPFMRGLAPRHAHRSAIHAWTPERSVMYACTTHRVCRGSRSCGSRHAMLRACRLWRRAPTAT